MTQQINLYQPIFRTQKKVFSAATIAQAAGVFIAGLLIIYGYASWQVATLGTNVDALVAQRDGAMNQLQALTAATSQPRSRLLERQLESLTLETEQKARLLQAFETRTFGNTRGFSHHFAGLARQRIDGLWLTRVLVSDSTIALAGATEAGELVPRYLARLSDERAFAGTEFRRLELARAEDGLGPVEFVVSTEAQSTE